MRKVFGILGVFALCFVAIILLAKLKIGIFATNLVNPVIRPILAGLSSAEDWVTHTISLPFKAKTLALKVDELEGLTRQLTAENARFLELQNENVQLRRELNFIERIQYPFALARVIGRVKEAGGDFFILNRGGSDGVAVDQPVVSDGILIGKIIRVQKSVSIAVPLTTSGLKTAAMFTENTATDGIVEGELNVSLKMSLISKDITLINNMIVITSGLEQTIPRGFVIGKIERIESKPNDLFQTAYLKIPTSLQNTTLVNIILYHAID
ncbi:MAG: Cell shape-determining protein MreC [Parcubacteria group bacterium GW2011_GWC2_45_7]|nr:MAG: Cell shape-determining protein MreC [Parcubacteria group bacterium GW2011_GWC2_45_7]KKU73834.1 MAG: Cell shape-determining protein MreC [Parcubacteria group bacterium GW2011_GWA2_47_26]